jgi:hypothetical protein
MPAWEAFEAERPSSSNQSEFPFFMLQQRGSHVQSQCRRSEIVKPILTPLLAIVEIARDCGLSRRACRNNGADACSRINRRNEPDPISRETHTGYDYGSGSRRSEG